MTALPNEVPEEAPSAVQSERAVLSACLWSAEAMAEAVKLLSDDDWWWPIHADLWRIMRGLHGGGVRVEPQAVYPAARRHGRGHLDVLTGLATAGLPAGQVGYHCGLITQAAQLRALRQVLRRGWQQATGADVEPVGTAEDIIEQLRLTQRMQTQDTTQVDFLDLVRRRQTPQEWVIPGLMGRGNRMILTSPEGYGKSTLLRQMAVTASAGLQPFHPEEAHEPRRVYVLDAENPADINTAEYGRIHDFLDQFGMLPKPNQLIVDEVGPNFNLLDPRNAAAVLARVDRFRPDLIVAGPIYQLHDENPNDEAPARKLAGVFDRLVGVHRSALITEAHTPHSDGPAGQLMRPFGASLWKRWPEFGFCLHPVQVPREANEEARHIAEQMKESRFSEWRGQRGRDRAWPRFLSVGARLPWEEHTPLAY